MSRSRRSIEQAMAGMAQFWPQANLPAAQIMTRIYRLRDIALRQVSSIAAPHGISASELDVLAALRSAGPSAALRPSELLDGLMLTSGGLTKILHGLEGKGLVERPEQASDRRARPVCLTPKGRDLAERTLGAILEHETAILDASITRGEQALLITLLDQLLDGFDGPSPDRSGDN